MAPPRPEEIQAKLGSSQPSGHPIWAAAAHPDPKVAAERSQHEDRAASKAFSRYAGSRPALCC